MLLVFPALVTLSKLPVKTYSQGMAARQYLPFLLVEVTVFGYG